ncbi:MAG: AAA family ATPase [Acidimicrobiaceae bacterium]|nr:AAA family ATPase [Acidimicrobiaceae bacterium]
MTIQHPYQLRRIELRDFKSVAHASVDLRPLTVVVGANSSGKSTLLQSILAVTQAVRSGTPSAEFPLNGEFVRLGTFEETRNYLATQPGGAMEVAFRLTGWRGYRTQRFSRGSEAMRDRELTEFAWRAYLGKASDKSEPGGGFARIESLQIEIETIEPSSGERTTALTCDVSDFDPSADLVDPTDHFGPRSRYAVREGAVEASGRVQDWMSGTSGPVNAVVMSGGLPLSLMRSVRTLDQVAEIWWDTAETLLEEEISREIQAAAESTESDPKPKVTRSTRTRAVDRAQADIEGRNFSRSRETAGPDLLIGRGTEAFGDPLARRWYRDLGQLTKKDRTSIARSMVQLGEAQFRSELRERLSAEDWIDDTVLVEHTGAAGEALWRAGSVSQRFFGDAVRYLGPLREAPHVLYDPGPSKLDLGVRGEYLAAVLHAQARTWVRMPTAEGTHERRRLNDALNYWLREFELAHRARSEDRGRMGIGLSVTPQALDREVDLTSVGVGVSQILPVIVLCLLAAPGTLVILEQPELHLHPRLEQILADFLLACARSGRQLVVETHSEHLVNRLRYRIASDHTASTYELIKLVFAESQDGVTSYREPEINQYGGTGGDWPVGFLDLGAREAQELVRESLAKRKRDTAASASD